MKLCGILKQGRAQVVFLSKEILKQMPKKLKEKYNEGDSLVLCELEKGKCPYDNQERGIEVSYMDEDDIYSICRTKGLINDKIISIF